MPSPMLSRGGQHPPSDRPPHPTPAKTAQRLSDKPGQELSLDFLHPNPTSFHYDTRPNHQQGSPSPLDVLIFPPPPSARPGKQKNESCQLCPCSAYKPLSLPLSQVKSTNHLERPGIIQGCSALLPTYPLQTPALKTPPRGNVRATRMGGKSLRQRDAGGSPSPPNHGDFWLQPSILHRVRAPSLCKAARRWPRENR